MKTIATFLRIGIATSIIVLFSGCATDKPTGAIFKPQTPSSPDKALVYFYRPSGESFGYERTYFVAVNQRKVGDLFHGRYFTYEASPGKLALLSDVNKDVRRQLSAALGGIGALGLAAEAAANPQAAKLEIDVEPGKTYYVRMHPETSFTHFTPHLSLVTTEVGESEISRGCLR
jgi:hypothetical protein